MNPDTTNNFLNIINYHGLVGITKLLQWRLLGSTWKDNIENQHSVRSVLDFRNKLQQILYVNPDIYDENYYKRQVLRMELIEEVKQYRELTIPTITWCLSDFEEDNSGEKIYFVSARAAPREFRLFAQIYCHTPNIKIRVYPHKIISKIHLEQSSMIGEYVQNTRGSNIMLFTPLCYAKHYRKNLKDRQYITVLCFVNVIDADLDQDFPDEDERFTTITLDVNDLDNNEQHFRNLTVRLGRITQSIMSQDSKKKIKEYMYPQNIAEKCQTFDKCLEDVIGSYSHSL